VKKYKFLRVREIFIIAAENVKVLETAFSENDKLFHIHTQKKMETAALPKTNKYKLMQLLNQSITVAGLLSENDPSIVPAQRCFLKMRRRLESYRSDRFDCLNISSDSSNSSNINNSKVGGINSKERRDGSVAARPATQFTLFSETSWTTEKALDLMMLGTCNTPIPDHHLYAVLYWAAFVLLSSSEAAGKASHVCDGNARICVHRRL